jgi:hypothetical protein
MFGTLSGLFILIWLVFPSYSQEKECPVIEGKIALASVAVDNSKPYYVANCLITIKEYPNILLTTAATTAETNKILSKKVLMELQHHELMGAFFGKKRNHTIYDPEAVNKKVRVQYDKKIIASVGSVPIYRIISIKNIE